MPFQTQRDAAAVRTSKGCRPGLADSAAQPLGTVPAARDGVGEAVSLLNYAVSDVDGITASLLFIHLARLN